MSSRFSAKININIYEWLVDSRVIYSSLSLPLDWIIKSNYLLSVILNYSLCMCNFYCLLHYKR